MGNLKDFSEFINESQTNDSAINLIVDTSGAISPQAQTLYKHNIEDALTELPFGKFSKILVIACGNEVENVRSLIMGESTPKDNARVLNFVKDCITGVHGSGGSDLQPAIDYIIKNKYEKNKTFIISDFATTDFDDKKLDITKIQL